MLWEKNVFCLMFTFSARSPSPIFRYIKQVKLLQTPTLIFQRCQAILYFPTCTRCRLKSLLQHAGPAWQALKILRHVVASRNPPARGARPPRGRPSRGRFCKEESRPSSGTSCRDTLQLSRQSCLWLHWQGCVARHYGINWTTVLPKHNLRTYTTYCSAISMRWSDSNSSRSAIKHTQS